MEKVKEKTAEDYLINKVIEVKPILRESNWLGKGHDGEFMFTGTEFSTQLPISRVSGQFVQIMDKEEQRAFEKELALKEGDLSFYNRQSLFWQNFRVKLSKEGKTLDLSKPYDYIAYKVLKVDRRVAHSWSDRYASGEYKFALVDKDEEIKVSSSKADIKLEAYKIFAKISDKPQDMRDLLKVMTNQKTKSAKPDFLKSEIERLIEADTKKFVDTYNDPNLKTKIFIEKALEVGALDRTPTKGYKIKGTEDADAIGDNLTETITFLQSPANSDVYLRIKSQIEQASK